MRPIDPNPAHSPPSSGSSPTEVLTFCLTDAERIELQKAAERCGLSLPDWVHDRVLEAAKREAKEA